MLCKMHKLPQQKLYHMRSSINWSSCKSVLSSIIRSAIVPLCHTTDSPSTCPSPPALAAVPTNRSASTTLCLSVSAFSFGRVCDTAYTRNERCDFTPCTGIAVTCSRTVSLFYSQLHHLTMLAHKHLLFLLVCH
jgi:MFS-type transporter involved in bile tolerance (Atg22 family)